MDSSHELHRLIRSMTRGELRRFRLSIKKYSRRANYLRLFDAVLEQEEYDEDRLRQALGDDGSTRRLSAAKSYLFTLILRSLADQADVASPTGALALDKRDIPTLIERKLFGSARKRVERAKHICREYELFDELLQILAMESRLPDANRELVIAESKELIDRLEETYHLVRFCEDLTRYVNEIGKCVHESERERLEEIVAALPLADGSRASTATGKVFYHLGRAAYHSLRDEYEDRLRHEELGVQTLRESPAVIDTTFPGFLILYSNLCSSRIAIGRFDEARATIEALREFPLPGRIARAKGFYLYLMELYHSTSVVDVSAALELVARYPAIAREHPDLARFHEPGLRLLFAHAHLHAGRSGPAIEELNAIADLPPSSKRSTLATSIRLMLIPIHYDLGNFELLPYLWRSAYRAFGRADLLGESTRKVLTQFRRLGDVYDRQSERRWFEEAYELAPELEELTRKGLIVKFDYIAWIEARLHGIDYATAYRRRQMAAG